MTVEDVLLAKKAKNLLEGRHCKNCALVYEHKGHKSPFQDRPNVFSCRIIEEKTDGENSCAFWLEQGENWYEYVKGNGFTLEDMKHHWFL